MTERPETGLYAPRPRSLVIQELVSRARRRILAMPEDERIAAMENAVFHERKRLGKQSAEPGEQERLDALVDAVMHGTTDAQLDATLALVAEWVGEIHGSFSLPAYRFASSVFPPALAALLTARPRRLRDWDLRVEQRIEVDGDLPLLRKLAKEATLVLAPTHVSNLDSPLIGLALTLAGLPPFQYGAGLNLFSNPVLGWWMSRLGAYTVDRTKQAWLYKDVLKDYSVYQLKHRHHSLFFPGGTRSRSGSIETRIKKGLLGTAVLAWQEMLADGRPDAEVYVVPLTLSFQLTLEANTLIDDFLAEAGKQRYIISDDEFTEPRRIAQFLNRVASLDDAIVCRFGDPIDVIGRPVPKDPLERRTAARRRRDFVCDREGKVQWDAQRDRVYTDRLADALVQAYPRNATLMHSHVAAWVAWRMLEGQQGTTDPFRIVRSSVSRRRLDRRAMLAEIVEAMNIARRKASEGAYHLALPDTASELLEAALHTFGAYHRSKALAADGPDIVVEDPRLCLYYRNRAVAAQLEG